MIPLKIYKTTPGLLQKKSQWRVIDPGVLSPWNVMSWGVRQLKGFVVSESDSAPELQVQELILVDNLQEMADRVVKKATGGTSSKLDLIYSKEIFVEEFAGLLNDATELSDSDLEVLLIYLSRDSDAIAFDGKVNWVIYNLVRRLANHNARLSSSSLQMIMEKSHNRTPRLHPSRPWYRLYRNRSQTWKLRSLS
jgi:hypothetical protein